MEQLKTFAVWIWPFIAIAIVFFGQNYFPEWIKRQAGFGFDQKLAKLSAELQETNTRLTSQLEARQHEIESLRQGALSGAANRQAMLDAQRLKAAEAIWRCLVELGQLKMICQMMAIVKIEPMAKLAAQNPEMRKMLSLYGQHIDPAKFPGSDAANHRPFLTDTVWAYFSA